MVKRKKKLTSKHDDPNSPIVFRNWDKDLKELIDSMPRGIECVVADCDQLPTGRGAFLCKKHGIAYQDSYKGIDSLSERARAQYNWLKQHVLIEDPE
jgi:hypothetical protein